MTTFALVRHASHAWLKHGLAGRQKGIHLSSEGVKEAKMLAKNLSHLPVAAVYSSPLERTKETAIFLSNLGPDSVMDDAAFLEIDFGLWSGASFLDLEGDSEWRHWNEQRATARAPRGESMAEVQTRAVKRLGNLAQDYPNQLVVIVTHCDVIRAVLLHGQKRSLNSIHQLTVEPASVSLIEWNDHGAKVLAENVAGISGPIELPASTWAGC